MSSASKRIAGLSPEEKRALLARLLQEKASQSQPSYPLSCTQQGWWFVNQVELNPASNLIAAFRLTGPLNIPALERSFNEIVRRHEVLRTSFPVVGDQPVQLVAPSLALTLPLVDLRQLPEAERVAEVQRLAREEAQRRFHLAQGPLLRASLLRLGEEEHVVLFTIHHMIFDFWSGVILIDELAALYEAFSTGSPATLPDLPIQYKDFAHWQRRWLQGETAQSQLSYWMEKLDGVPPLFHSASDSPRAGMRSLRGKHYFFELSPSLYESLKELSRKEGVTLFVTLLAAFKVLLYRYTGQTDVNVGSPILGRNSAKTERLIGCLANILVLRTDLSGDPTFQNLLGRVREMAFAAYAHQDVPYVKLVEAIWHTRNLSRDPLFQAMFDFMKVPLSSRETSEGLTLSPVDVDSELTYFDLFMMMTETTEKVRGSLGYSTDLFDAETIEHLVSSYCRILEQCVDHPETRLSRFELPANPAAGPPRAKPLQQRHPIAITSTFTPPRTPVEQELTRIWAEVLELEQISINDNFFEMGGDSVMAIDIFSRIGATFHVELSPLQLVGAPTVFDLAPVIEAASKLTLSVTPNSQAEVDKVSYRGSLFERAVTDLSAEAALDATIRPETVASAPVTEPTCIFLTGATGFLGAFLLSELLHQTHADIYCLTRAANAEEGKKKLQRTLESYSLWHESQSPRIIPVVGNLSQPLLGLSAEQFRLLAGKIDVIYHNGALVNFLYPYAALKASNVLGTQEVLRLASQIKVKPVYYISTLGVFSLLGDSEMRVIREQDTLDHGGGLYDGYAQSKWVAEKLVTLAHARELPVCIYRPGHIAGHSQTGVCNSDDFASGIIQGCIRLGSVPDLDMMVNITPVDYVSRAIVHLSRQKQSLGKIFHVVNPSPIHLRELFTWIHTFGYPLRKVPYDQWRAELSDLAGRSQEHALYALLPLFSRVSAGRINMPRFDCQNTFDGLTGTSIVCPPADAELFKTYLSYFIRSGFLDAPTPEPVSRDLRPSWQNVS